MSSSMLLFLIPLAAAILAGYLATRVEIRQGGTYAKRMAEADRQPERKATAVERVGRTVGYYAPGYLKNIESDLYWVAFANPGSGTLQAAAILGRQVVMALIFALAFLAVFGNIGLLLGAWLGWTISRSGLRSKAEYFRSRIAMELPEFVQVMAAESASGAGLDELIRRSADGTGFMAGWMRRVLNKAAGKDVVRDDGSGAMLEEAHESGHPALISLAVQLGFVGAGAQKQSLLKGLAQSLADDFIAASDTRAEKLGSNMTVMASVFYVFPFVMVLLVIIGVPLLSAMGQ